jgi:SAM-dependent methyltransferase
MGWRSRLPGRLDRHVENARVHRPYSAKLLEAIGPGNGWRAIDVGCGPGGILDLLAAWVGADGIVVGLDQLTEQLPAARAFLQTRGGTGVHLLAADARVPALRAGTFDLAHARFVPNVAEIVESMLTLVRSGGVVAIETVDLSSWICSPPHPAWTRLHQVVRSYFERVEVPGRQAPALLRSLGVREIEAEVYLPGVTSPADFDHTFLPYVADIFRAEVSAGGEVDDAELGDLIETVGAHLQDPASFTLRPTLCQAWGRRP